MSFSSFLSLAYLFTTDRQRRAETLLVGTALVRVDGVGEGVHRLRVAAVPLHRDLDLVAGTLAGEVDDAGVDRILGPVDVLDEIDQAARVVEGAVLDLVRRRRIPRPSLRADFGASAVSLTTSSTTSSPATRSSIRLMVNPLLRNAISCSRRATVSKS